MSSQLLLLFAFSYALLLFLIAWRAERWKIKGTWLQPLVYSLSLAVYCTSWTFLGAVGRATDNGWAYLPIYLGPVLLFVFGWPFVRRLLVVASRNKVTSIADFIGSRYGKDQWLAAVVTVVAVIGTLPYIALQLKAISLVWTTVNLPITDVLGAVGVPIKADHSSSFVTALLMAWFAILFGTRIVDGPRRHQGMITSIAFESMVKLLAFIAVGVFAIYCLGQSAETINLSAAPLTRLPALNLDFITQTLLALVAIFCLPRQFHVMVVEYQGPVDARWARWVFPAYLILFSVLIVPIALAGQQLLAQSGMPADAYVMLLPMAEGQQWLTVLVFIGALSAATGMVVIATVTLSIMISNELVVPAWLWLSSRQHRRTVDDLGGLLQLLRRSSIVLLLLLAWWMESSFRDSQGLASMGLISFAAAAQLTPAIVAGLYWPAGHRRGVLAGLLLGIVLWAYCLLLPALLGKDHSLLISGPGGAAWLSPINLFGTGSLGALSHGVCWSLLVNCAVFYVVSRLNLLTSLELRQANVFTQLRDLSRSRHKDFEPTDIQVSQLQTLQQPLMGPEKDSEQWQEFEQRLGHRLLPQDRVPRFVVQAVESNLATYIGAVSAHRAISVLSRQQPVQINEFISLMGGRNRHLLFGEQLLQTTLETIPQGISVVDEKLQLVAWNQRYQELFDYPSRLLYIGCSIQKVYQYNADRGYFAINEGQDREEAILRRLQLLREGKPYRFERLLPNGRVVEIQGTPMSNHGYVTTYMDITEYREAVDQLEQVQVTLEERVAERTLELSEVNSSLQHENALRARIEQELSSVYRSKSRFLAAASHDLLQPVNAARLFVATMQQKLKHTSVRGEQESLETDINHIDSALSGVENLISSLREVSRLDSGKLVPKRENFCIADLLTPLSQEFKLLAEHNQLQFRWVNSQQWVYSDQQLLRRVLQNFLSNALRYTRQGKVLLGCRRHRDTLSIEVWDTGPGIAEKDNERIFEEFERLHEAVGGDTQKGLGLGLSIASRMAQLLGNPLAFDSVLGKGSVFRIRVPLGARGQAKAPAATLNQEALAPLNILCIDNEASILVGMQALLEQWGCTVTCALSLGDVLEHWTAEYPPDVVLADYHLDDGETGLHVLQALSLHWSIELPAIVISANNTDELREQVKAAGYLFLPKPLQPAALRGCLRRLSKAKP